MIEILISRGSEVSAKNRWRDRSQCSFVMRLLASGHRFIGTLCPSHDPAFNMRLVLLFLMRWSGCKNWVLCSARI